jgi:arylsulfatase A-like enzyme
MMGGSNASEDEIRSRYRGYYAAVSEIDREIGRILEHLEATGQLDNTIIIYTADHGCALGHQGFWGKGNSTRPLNMAEVSLRIPLIMRWPAHIPAGMVIERCVDHYDTFQTLCAWIGVDLAPRADRAFPGHSFATLVTTGEDAAWDETRYGEYGDLRMIRTPQYKFVKRYPHGPYDLFDLRNDPGETLNRAGWPSLADVQDRLEAQLERWYADHEDPRKSGLHVKDLRQHNASSEAWRDGLRERRGLQVY